MVKCFLSKSFEYLIVYIPSKYRFKIESIPNGSAIYYVEELDNNSTETKELSDYSSKMTSTLCEDFISEDKNINTYQDLKKEYDREIIIDGDDEPTIKKLRRQLDRLKLPFMKLSITLGLQRGRYFSLCLDEYDSTNYVIKKYNSTKNNFYILYFCTLEKLVDNLEDISDNINNIKKQFYKIIKKISLSNIDKIGFVKLNSNMWDYEEQITTLINNYNTVKDKEDNLISITNGLDPKDVRNRNDISIYNKKRIDLVNTGIKTLNEFHTKILTLEEIGFDNLLMMTRVKKNFSILENL